MMIHGAARYPMTPKARFGGPIQLTPQQAASAQALGRVFDAMERGEFRDIHQATTDFTTAPTSQEAESHWRTIRTFVFVDLIDAIKDKTFLSDFHDFNKGLKQKLQAQPVETLQELIAYARQALKATAHVRHPQSDELAGMQFLEQALEMARKN